MSVASSSEIRTFTGIQAAVIYLREQKAFKGDLVANRRVDTASNWVVRECDAEGRGIGPELAEVIVEL